jgi:hypothetical protein
VPVWLRYTLLRVLVFAVPLAVLLFLGVHWLWSALIASVVAFCVSFIFLRRRRDEVAQAWAARRPVRTRDDVAEDAAIDAADDAADDAAGDPGSGAGDRTRDERGAES